MIPVLAVLATIASDCSVVIPTLAVFAAIASDWTVVIIGVSPANAVSAVVPKTIEVLAVFVSIASDCSVVIPSPDVFAYIANGTLIN